jgi:hypothetical protein
MRLKIIARECGVPNEALDVVKVMTFRPEMFGAPFSELTHELLRNTTSVWSIGERELFAAYTAYLNKCPF